MRYHGLTLRDLEYVAAVAEHGQFGRAAEACAVSQPALSAQVRKVEEAVGIVVFERSPRRTRVTPDGAAVLKQINRILAEADSLFQLGLATAGLLSGPVRIGVIATLAAYLLPHVLREFRQAFPGFEPLLVEGLTDGLLTKLRDGELDAVLLSTPIDDHGLEVEPLFREPFLAAVPASSPLADRDHVTLAEIDGDGLILLEEGHCLRRQALDLCPSSARGGARRVLATGVETLRQMIAAGIGHSMLPALAATGSWGESGPMAGLVRYLPIRREGGGEPPCREIALVWRHAMPGGEEFRRLGNVIVRAKTLAASPGSRPTAMRSAASIMG